MLKRNSIVSLSGYGNKYVLKVLIKVSKYWIKHYQCLIVLDDSPSDHQITKNYSLFYMLIFEIILKNTTWFQEQNLFYKILFKKKFKNP